MDAVAELAVEAGAVAVAAVGKGRKVCFSCLLVFHGFTLKERLRPFAPTRGRSPAAPKAPSTGPIAKVQDGNAARRNVDPRSVCAAKRSRNAESSLPSATKAQGPVRSSQGQPLCYFRSSFTPLFGTCLSPSANALGP